MLMRYLARLNHVVWTVRSTGCHSVMSFVVGTTRIYATSQQIDTYIDRGSAAVGIASQPYRNGQSVEMILSRPEEYF